MYVGFRVRWRRAQLPVRGPLLLPTGGGTFNAAAEQGSDTLIAVGIADVPMNDVSHPTLGAVFCVGPTSASAINNVAGLPGPARVTIAGTATGLP
jgi:hypothetical protein